VPVRFLDHRFILVTGKGGVGKSTVAAPLALAAARRGKRVLVCELKTAERISRLLGAPPVGTEIRRVAPGIDAVNMTPASALREVGLLKLRLKTLYRLTFENRVVADFLRGIPGLPELLLLGKCFFHEQERDPATGQPRWDLILVDAPATGHGIPFLRIPKVIVELFGDSPLAREAREIQALLEDPERTSLSLVRLPEELPTAEALALKAQVDELLRMPTGFLFINQVLLPLLDPAQAEQLDLLREQLATADGPVDPRLSALLGVGCSWCRRLRQQRPYLERLTGLSGMPCILLPRLFATALGPAEIQHLASHLAARLDEAEGAR